MPFSTRRLNILPYKNLLKVDESYFGAKRINGKRGRAAAGKKPVSGILPPVSNELDLREGPPPRRRLPRDGQPWETRAKQFTEALVGMKIVQIQPMDKDRYVRPEAGVR